MIKKKKKSLRKLTAGKAWGDYYYWKGLKEVLLGFTQDDYMSLERKVPEKKSLH